MNLYVDASFSPQQKKAVCGYMITEGEIYFQEISDTSCTAAEIAGCIWALETVNQKGVQVMTDSQAIMTLPDRRQRLESCGFVSQRSAKVLAHAELYKHFYKAFDIYCPTLIKVKGHRPSSLQTEIESQFSIIDKAVRARLREIL